ncbi:MAG TPA: Plug domain-containing protein [Gemmatimonadaceae bacterium]|nr:Plug domain-containing protein [Gemmatimonadaceae bacterium]
MLARIHRALGVGMLATLGVVACAPATSSSISEGRQAAPALPLTASSRVIDAERIQRSGSQSALDAIRALVPGYRSIDTSPIGTGWTGVTGMSRGQLRVIVDGHPISDAESLRMIRATDVLAIHVLSASDATIRFGAGFTGGVIVIQTLATLRRL